MISIIIPTYNEEKNIRNFIYDLYCLNNIKEQQVIFVDGGSTDTTLNILEELKHFGYTYYTSNKKGRANQMNFGASLATNELLWFVHADSTLDKDAIDKILQSKAKVGCLKIRFYPPSLAMKVNALSSTKRVKRRNIAFGDQGIFVTKKIFNKIGGYKNMPIMEDYKFSEDISALGLKFTVIDAHITTSARRYKNNTFKTMYNMKKLQKMYRDGADIEEIAKKYKDIR